MKRDQHPMLRIENIELEVLKPWAMNPRKNDKTVDFLIRSIRQFGFNVPILCDSKYRVIAGHARLKAAHEIGMCRVPVIILPLAGRKKQAFALAENKVNEVSEWDDAKLRVVIEDILESDMNLKDLGFSDREVRNLSRGNSAEIEDPHVPIRKRQTAPVIFSCWEDIVFCVAIRSTKMM
jgi:ParB-like chromosome segregation protein Spo0J